MGGLIEVLGTVLAALAALATAIGAWAWWQLRASQPFWVVLRAAQGAAMVLAAAAGLAALLGKRPEDGLFWVYALVPVVVSYVAEQLRVISADAVLAERGIEDAQALGRRSEADQHSVVLAIVRRETGVMTLAAGVLCFLALRAVDTAAGL